MNETYIKIEKLKDTDSNVLFIIGDSPTVTFNENVTVFTYPQVIYTNEVIDVNNTDKHFEKKENNKNKNKFYSFFKSIFKNNII